MLPTVAQPIWAAARRALHDPNTMRCAVLMLAATLAVLTAGAATAGGELNVDWSTSDAGGGTATGGNFSLEGTIAQVDADTLQPSSGGNFELTGGFWVVDAAVPDLIFRDDFEMP